ncbi:hypothetical protein GIB67_007352 [Kingdonia uniflora]|uniref:cAMP-regulated phosphoprotein 19-related protein n=1 Tax=Kingdonia uniflora TaxID=39325 RepID=A0A7J7NXA7_9MAGN|nr:hypothetical protein GIB67_007352 [Kingdonia uniflora]
MTDISENKTNVLLLKLPFFCVAEFKMTGTDPIDINNQKIVEDINEDNTHEDPEQSDAKEENTMPSPHEEEAAMKKKYGGMLPKKPPLISKDHERAFFDSADWALGKQGAPQKPKGPLEALRPKLQMMRATVLVLRIRAVMGNLDESSGFLSPASRAPVYKGDRIFSAIVDT